MFVATSSGLSSTILIGYMDTPSGMGCTMLTTKHWKESPSHPRCGTKGSSKVYMKINREGALFKSWEKCVTAEHAGSSIYENEEHGFV